MDLRKQDGCTNRYLQITKGNYLPEATKSKALELFFNDKQEFEFKGQYSDRTYSFGKSKFTGDEKTAIMEEVRILHEKEMSLDKIRDELAKLGFSSVPAKGTLSNWLNEKNVHPDIK